MLKKMSPRVSNSGATTEYGMVYGITEVSRRLVNEFMSNVYKDSAYKRPTDY